MSVYITQPGRRGWWQMQIARVWVGTLAYLPLPVAIVSRWQEAIFDILRLERVRAE